MLLTVLTFPSQLAFTFIPPVWNLASCSNKQTNPSTFDYFASLNETKLADNWTGHDPHRPKDEG